MKMEYMNSSPLPKVLLAVAGVVTLSLWASTLLTPGNQINLSTDTPRPSFSLQTEQKQVALWFGDSFVQGAGASKRSKGFSYRVSQHFGLFHKDLSVGGSGYIGNREEAIKRCGEEDCLRLIEVLKKQVMLRADVIFVQAGLNDAALTPQNSSAIWEFYKALRVTYPESIIISVSPTTPFANDREFKENSIPRKKVCDPNRWSLLRHWRAPRWAP